MVSKKRPAWVVSLLVVHFGLGSTTYLYQETARTQRLIETIHTDADTALRQIPAPAMLFYETDCTEFVRVGWIASYFPRRCFVDSCRVLTFPRPSAKLLSFYYRAYPNRSCWYYHRDPGTLLPEVRPCAQATDVFNRRPRRDKQMCPMIASTASKLGL